MRWPLQLAGIEPITEATLEQGGSRRDSGPPMQPFIELSKLIAAALIGALVTADPSARVSRDRPRSLEQAQILLCVSGAIMMIIIGNSLARAFGIAGAAGIVRFRTPVDDPKDVTILFLLMGLGMATGLGAFAVAGLATAFLCITLLVLERLATQRTRLMSVEMSAPGRSFPTRHVEAVFVRNEVVFEPREISQGKNDITVKYHTWLDPRASLDDLSAQLMAEGAGRGIGVVGSGQAGQGVTVLGARCRCCRALLSRVVSGFTSRTMNRTSPSRIRPSSSRASASMAAGSSR